MLELPLPPTRRALSRTSPPIFPAANRMQRAAFDLRRRRLRGATTSGPGCATARWPADRFPLRRDFEASPKWEPGQDDYAFVRVDGDGVHEIPVGPVHAGIIEPGHFRFSVVGEKVLRLEERLGYVHKGIEKRFERADARRRRTASPAASPAIRTVAYAWAYAQAAEARRRRRRRRRARAGCARCCSSASASPTTSATSAALGNDAGFAFGLAQFSRLKEDWLRAQRRGCSATAS